MCENRKCGGVTVLSTGIQYVYPTSLCHAQKSEPIRLYQSKRSSPLQKASPS